VPVPSPLEHQATDLPPLMIKGQGGLLPFRNRRHRQEDSAQKDKALSETAESGGGGCSGRFQGRPWCVTCISNVQRVSWRAASVVVKKATNICDQRVQSPNTEMLLRPHHAHCNGCGPEIPIVSFASLGILTFSGFGHVC
jgi:hypothetical protein